MTEPSVDQGTRPEAPAESAPRGWAGRVFRGPLQSFASRNYRYLWLGSAGHALSLWMEIVARNWLVWELTGSGVAVALVNVFRTLPTLFLALPAGVVSDRVNRRVVLIVSQLANIAIYGLIGALLLLRMLELWHVYVLMFLRGVAISFNQPARQALMPTLVKPEQITNAIALQQTAINGSRFIGPLIAGALLDSAGGSAAVFLTMAGLYVFVTWTTLLLQLPKNVPLESQRARGRMSRWAEGGRGGITDMKEGLLYAIRHPIAVGVLSFMLVALFFGQAYQTLLPYFAEKVFAMGPKGYSTFVAVIGVGSLLAPLLFASLGEFHGKGFVIVTALALEGIALAFFAFTPWLLAGFVLMGLIGFVDSANRLVSNSLLLSRTDRAYHGRIMSLLLLDRGFVPFGSLIAGLLLDVYGGTVAMLFMGIGLIAAVLVTAAFQLRFLRNA